MWLISIGYGDPKVQFFSFVMASLVGPSQGSFNQALDSPNSNSQVYLCLVDVGGQK